MTFPVSPANNDIATFSGVRYVYVASKNAWVKTPLSYILASDLSDLTDTGGLLGGGSGEGGVTTYATISELIAAANISGSIGLVTGGNFYINSGTGWSKIDYLLGTEPNPPTIGTASVSGSFPVTQATVDFTAPTYTGGVPITSYTATSDQAEGSGTLSQSGSGAIEITGLLSNTTYTFTVNATNSAGTSFSSAASNSITTDTKPLTQKAIFGYGWTNTQVSITNLVSNTGVVATDTAGVGTARKELAAAGYGGDKAIFGFGTAVYPISLSTTNLVSNTGVVSASYTSSTGVGSERYSLAAAGYGEDKAIFGYGYNSSSVVVSITNLVSNTGAVSSYTTGVGTARYYLAAAGYGGNKAIFGFGYSGNTSITNLVSNTGVVASDTTGVGTARRWPSAAGYGADKAIFGYGYTNTIVSLNNLVSNTGVVATDTTGVGTARRQLAAAGYGEDKAIFGYGYSLTNITNLVSNTGVVSADTTGVGTARYYLAAAGYSLS